MHLCSVCIAERRQQQRAIWPLRRLLVRLIDCWPVHVGKGFLAFVCEPVADAIVQKVGAVAQDEDKDDWPHMGFEQFPALLD